MRTLVRQSGLLHTKRIRANLRIWKLHSSLLFLQDLGWLKEEKLPPFFCVLLIYKSINKMGPCSQRISKGHLGLLFSPFPSQDDLICGIYLPLESRSTEDITVYSIHESFHCFMSLVVKVMVRTTKWTARRAITLSFCL